MLKSIEHLISLVVYVVPLLRVRVGPHVLHPVSLVDRVMWVYPLLHLSDDRRARDGRPAAGYPISFILAARAVMIALDYVGHVFSSFLAV